MSEAIHPQRIRFGPFILDVGNCILSKKGLKVPLQDQPFKVLSLLLHNPGRIVTREELKRELWPTDTFVDFEHSLNKDIHHIRLALGDSLENPIYLETVARHGYRFIHPVAYDILQQLKLNVIEETKIGNANAQPVDPEAYKSYLMGRYHRYQMTQDFGKDILFFKKSIEKDPAFAEPYAAMAVCYVLQCVASKINPQEAFTQARAAAQKALELDPNLAEAHAALGIVKFGFEYDWAGGKQELQRALELKPNSAEININYAWYLVMTGQFEEAIAKNLRAIDLDPLNPVNNFSYGWTCLMARRFDEGIEFTKKLLDQDSTYPHARLRLSELYAAKGMHKDALEGIDQIEKSQTPFLAWVYAVSGEPAKSRALMAELEEKRKHEYVDAIFLARGFAGLGERDKAFAWLETAFQERSPHLVTLKVFPGFDGLRSDRRYQNLLERIGLAN